MASDDLFLLDIKDGEDKAKWMIVQAVGINPGKRYGHTLSYFKPFVVAFGGNTGSETVNDILILNIEKTPSSWSKLNIDNGPCARVYHSAALCTYGSASGMLVIFGGRSKDQKPLNDSWGLRCHRDGKMDWIAAPYKDEKTAPTPTFQHTSLFIGAQMVIIGGRAQKESDNAGIAIYDTELSDWIKVLHPRRFRHASWVFDNSIFYFGGFSQETPSLSIDTLGKIDYENLLKSQTEFYKSFIKFKQFFLTFEKPGKEVQRDTKKSINAIPNKKDQPKMEMPIINVNLPSIKYSNASVASIDYNNIIIKSISMKELENIGNSSPQIMPSMPTPAQHLKELANYFLRILMKPKDWLAQVNVNKMFMFQREEIIALTNECLKIIKENPIILRLRVPIKVFGDVHGQYQDLMRFFELWGSPQEIEGDIESYDYLFLGDYVDRGSHSLEVICLLMALKVKYPEQIHLIRGNHEDRLINNVFGFAEECAARLNENINDPNSVFSKINEMFEWLPLVAIIEDKILCIHGGIGSTYKKIDQVSDLQRPIQVIHEVVTPIQQLIVDLLWSDPSESDSEKGVLTNNIRDPNGSGNIVKFGPDIVFNFLNSNNLILILRAHECVMDGFERFAEGMLITVFSATDYCGRHKNAGAVLFITKALEIVPKLIYPRENDMSNWMMNESEKRPPTPPRWNAANFGRNESFE